MLQSLRKGCLISIELWEISNQMWKLDFTQQQKQNIHVAKEKDEAQT